MPVSNFRFCNELDVILLQKKIIMFYIFLWVERVISNFFTSIPSKAAGDREVPYLASKTGSGVDDEHADRVWRRKGRHHSVHPSKTVGHTPNKTLNRPRQKNKKFMYFHFNCYCQQLCTVFALSAGEMHTPPSE